LPSDRLKFGARFGLALVGAISAPDVDWIVQMSTIGSVEASVPGIDLIEIVD